MFKINSTHKMDEESRICYRQIRDSLFYYRPVYKGILIYIITIIFPIFSPLNKPRKATGN